MKEKLRLQINLLIAKYEKLGIVTDMYHILCRLAVDEVWLKRIAELLDKVENSEKILNISKQINAVKNDQRVDEAFAEIDTIDNLSNSRFYGTFDGVVYQPPEKNKRWPDIVAFNGKSHIPVEVKLLTPQDLDENKFFQKLIDKVNNHALPQLLAYYNEHPFERGFIFVRTYKPVPLQNLEYYDLKNWIELKVPKQKFETVIMFVQYGMGMWDFYV